MASVYLTTTAPADAGEWDYNSPGYNGLKDLKRLQEAAQKCVFREHTLTLDALQADLIIFVGSMDSYHRDIRRSQLFRSFPDKCFVFDSGDRVIPFLPGVYASIERRWYFDQWTRSGFYLNIMDNQAIDFRPLDPNPIYLFSFVGSVRTSPVRRSVVKLSHPACLVADVESPQGGVFSHQNPDRVSAYADIMEKSKFVLCPRGVGTSSWRLFETMKMGRAPVIISDQWVQPVGPDWAAVSIRVPEKDVARIPRILQDREHEASGMGLAARSQWEKWYSKTSCFHRIASWCNELKTNRRLPRAVFRFAAHAQLLRPTRFRGWAPRALKGLLSRPRTTGRCGSNPSCVDS